MDLPGIRALQSLLPEPATELFVDGLPPGVTLVAVSDDASADVAIAGAEIASQTTGLSRPVGYVHAYDTGYVAELAVAPAHRGRGHGRALLSRCLVELAARGVEYATLEVAADNDVARSLYESLGFSVIERIPDRYDDADGLRMGVAIDA